MYGPLTKGLAYVSQVKQNQKYSVALGAIHILRKKNSGWVGLQNAYNCLFTLGNQTDFCIILLIMWVGGLKNRGKCAYVIYVWSLMNIIYKDHGKPKVI